MQAPSTVSVGQCKVVRWRLSVAGLQATRLQLLLLVLQAHLQALLLDMYAPLLPVPRGTLSLSMHLMNLPLVATCSNSSMTMRRRLVLHAKRFRDGHRPVLMDKLATGNILIFQPFCAARLTE